jgi:pimeloyl-ACP methyl ester carboxylesterase
VLAPAAEAIAAYIERERLRSASVIGHSGGGAMGLMLALAHPDKVGRLMVVDVLPFPAVLDGPADQAPQAVAAKAEAQRARVAALDDAAYVRALGEGIGNAVVAKEDAQRVLAWALASDRAVLAQADYDLATMDLRPQLPALKTPLTVVFADQASHGAPAGWMRKRYTEMYKGTPNVRVEEVPKSRHFLLMDQPEAFHQAVQRFLTPAA